MTQAGEGICFKYPLSFLYIFAAIPHTTGYWVSNPENKRR